MYGFKELDALQLSNLLQSKDESEIVLIDVRTPTEAARGGIAGARNVPLHLLPMMGSELNGEKPVVLYCHSGARSAQGCAFLTTRGHSNVYNLRGGILGWAQCGKPLESIQSPSAF